MSEPSADLLQASVTEAPNVPPGDTGLLEKFRQAEVQAAEAKIAIRKKLIRISGDSRVVMEDWKKSLPESRREQIREELEKNERANIEELGTFVGQDGKRMDVTMYIRSAGVGDMIKVRPDDQRPEVTIEQHHGHPSIGFQLPNDTYPTSVSEKFVNEGNVGSGSLRLNIPKLDPGDADPLDVAEEVVDFLKTATLKPADPVGQTPPSAPPPAPSV